MSTIPTTVKNRDLVEKRREQIVLAAIKLFSRYGYHGTTLRKLSQEANISYGNIYDYVGSKEDIFYLIHEYLSERVFERLENAVENITDPLEKLRRMVQAEFNFMDAWSEGILLLYQEGHVLKSPFLHGFLKKEREHVYMFEKAIIDCVQLGLLRKCNPRLTANLIKTTIDGWVLKRWDLRGHASREEAEKFILEMVFTGLLPRKLGDRHPNEAQDGLLSGKKAFVIGGETVLGAAICAAMAKAGAGVCTYLNDDRLPAGYTPPRYSSFGNDVMVCKSTTDGPMNESLYMKIIREFGPIDICIHELGVGTLEFPASESGKKELSILSASLEKNLNCAREMVHFLYEQMSKKPWGRVVYVAPWAWDHYTDALRHNMVVSGVVALTRSFSESLSDSNANVNCVVPGFIRTPRPSEIQKIKTWEAQQKIPINRFGEISDVVNSVLFLLDDRSKYVTNQVLRVAGGI